MAQARRFVFYEIGGFDLSQGLACLPLEQQVLVRDLAWYYDNVGALVLHDVVDLEPVAGYLGGSIIDTWEKMCPLIEAERAKRADSGSADPGRWQEYFQYLYNLVEIRRPQYARDKKLRASEKIPLRVMIRRKLMSEDSPLN
ncbi:hypothetical protein ACGFMK_41070 [Amycolatopsis sp. NPDC049252]|uniref:DUF4760 domain-containing protein n=1 Tax=Amycolatopsis sp. NPDC049252 TaxID=3363933 RepID=UPI0037205398